ncbi:hypothetical protein ACIQNU_11055 [Streptomyces sp. NPDC091292]|uniref:hypothetical protein n=1 Tax=Streptomyces sp. NPDC091292 TaxID=3365991 RepID=UPI003800DDE2
MAKPPVPPGFRRLPLELPADLVDWLTEFAAISHRTVDDVVRPLVEAERVRVEANWTTRPEPSAPAAPSETCHPRTDPGTGEPPSP